MNEELMKHLNDAVYFIKESSPVIWGALYKQQIIEGILVTIYAVVSSIIAIWFIHKSKGYKDPQVMIIVASLLLIFASVCFGIFGIPKLLNPTYYAIMELLPWKK